MDLLFHTNKNKSERHFAIIPHFMLDSEKVDLFYKYIDEDYYSWWWPNTIILISPNHFLWEEKKVKTICDSNYINYKKIYTNWSNILALMWVDCDDKEKIFYHRGWILQTDEHWIWEHFKYIQKYFSDSNIIPVVTPSFEFNAVDNIIPFIQNVSWDVLVIASVDFAHYQPEEQTLQHDEKSIEMIKKLVTDKWEIMQWIDADCPACIYLIQKLAVANLQSPDVWWRDSSSTILWQDMWNDNTSRIFMYYK
jgi:AmmeMemoRadiSam system protein B